MADASRLTIPQLIAQHVIKGKPAGCQVQVADLSGAISEVTLETQILGASFLTVTLADPDWGLQRSGLFGVNDGLLTPLDVNFPAGSSSWWRLCMVEGTSDLSQPNLTLTFEDRIIALLRDRWGAKAAPPGSMSRAQFIRQLVDEVTEDGGIRFVCPALRQGLPVATTPVGAKTTTKQTQTASAAAVNKSKGIHSAAPVTIKGSKPNAQQLADINTALGVAEQLNAGPVATEALICAGIGESNFDRNAVDSVYGTHKGVWQSDQIPPDQVAEQAKYFLIGGRSFGAGGAIALSRSVSDPGEIATRVEVSGTAGSFYGQWLGEAKAIIAAYGGASIGSQDPTGAATAPANSVSQLTRGTTDNPDEDSWDCITRLAQDVNWRAFSNARALYYMDDPQIVAQKPSLYLQMKDGDWVIKPDDKPDVPGAVASISYTFDNTAFIYQSTRVRKGRKIRRSRIAKPQTPSQVILNLVCGIDEFRAGEVFMFLNAGPIDGRWIVQDATRNCLADTFTQFTLGPPQAPTPESQVTGTTAAAARGSTGGAASIPGGTPAGTTVPAAAWNPDGKPVCKWIVPILTWAASHGWSGTVTSGYRTAAEQTQAAASYAASLGKPISAIYPDGPLASNHCKASFPGGAVDVSPASASQLASVLVDYPHTPNLTWGGKTIEDAVHFSYTGH